MARSLRIQYPGAVYHVLARGNHGHEIFRDDADRRCFLETLGEACEKTGWVVHSYVLMSNHYHLLLETPEANLVAGMKWVQGAYTQRYNSRHKLRGHLFQGRYKAVVVDGEEEPHFQVVSTYIHLNPARAKLIRLGQERLKTYPWSSYPLYLRDQRPVWLERRRVMGCMGLKPRDGKGYETPEKVALAWRLREGTTVSLRWVSERLAMGHYTRVTQAISRMKRRPGRKHEQLRRKLRKLE